MNTKQVRHKINSLKAIHDDERRQLKQTRERIVKTEQRVVDCEQAQALLQSAAKEVQFYVHSKLAGLVSTCLSTVFNDPYKFHIEFVEKRGKTDACMYFMRNGEQVDPMTASGGGVVDVAAFALRIACIMLSQPALRRVVVLDEPFKFVSQEFRSNIATMLEQLNDKLGIQIIMVTHIPELEVGDVIRL